MSAWLLFIGAVVALVGCTPEYDWREMTVADGRLKVAFPGRPQTETRNLELAGQPLPFILTAASVDKAVFATGYAPLPAAIAADPSRARGLGEALVRSLYVNLGVEPAAQLPLQGQTIVVRSQGSGADNWLIARVWVTETALIEAVATGTRNALPESQAREFVRSATLIR